MVEFGIPDDEFMGHDSAPMTKQEVRAVTLAKARIGEKHVLYDVGAGCGSISIEAAMIARNGKVLAIERDGERLALLKSNLEKFGVRNVEVVEGDAIKVLSDLPSADRIIIGGTGGEMSAIVRECSLKLKRGGRIVINAVTLESFNDALRTLEQLGLKFDVTQVAVSRSGDVGGKRMMKALNPVYIIDARR